VAVCVEIMEDNWSSNGRKRTWETELGDEPRHRKVAATLSGEEVTSLNRDGGFTSIAQQRHQRAGVAYESHLPVGASRELQHLIMRGQHRSSTSVEDTVQRHQVYAQPFQPTLPYSVMLQQQQRQVGNFLSEAAVATASTLIQASQLQGLTSGRSSHLPPLSGLSHLPRQQMHLPIALEPNATPVSQAQNFQALSGSEILRLLRHIQQPQPQGISSMPSETETNLQQHQLSAFSVANATPVSQAQMLQALGGRSVLLQRIQSQQGLFSAAAAAGSSVQQVLHFPDDSASNVSTSYETSQAQIMKVLLQHFQSQQELSSTAAAAVVAAPESNTQHQQMQDWQQKLALLAIREKAIRASGLVDQIAPSIQDDQACTRPVASAPPSLPTSSGITMWLPDDNHQLSEYQVTVRHHLEIFEAEQEDYESNIQGRKKKVIPGQAGIRCRHCSKMPLRHRGRGAVYYPLKLSGIYQAAQNMASSHLSDCCSQIPADVKQKLLDLRHRRDTAIGGKKYWAEAGSVSGLYETEEGLRLRSVNDGAAR
jgi:hypothetical protein